MTRIEHTPKGDWRAKPTIDNHKLTVRAKTKGEVERKLAALSDRQRNERLGIPDPTRRPESITFDALCDKALV